MTCSARNIHTGVGKAVARVGISKDRLWSRSDRGASAGLQTILETQIFLHKYSSHGFHDPLCNRNYRECPQAIVSWDSLSTLPIPTLRPLQKEFAAPGFIFAGFPLLRQNHLTSCTYFREPGVEFALAVQVVGQFGQLWTQPIPSHFHETKFRWSHTQEPRCLCGSTLPLLSDEDKAVFPFVVVFYLIASTAFPRLNQPLLFMSQLSITNQCHHKIKRYYKCLLFWKSF